MRYTIDRIEGDYAVLTADDESQTDILIALLPPDIDEGSILDQDEDGVFTVNKQAEEERRERIARIKSKLRRRTL